MKVYIAGPMTDMPNWNVEAFAEAERWYSDRGHTVLNPASHTPRVNPESITHAEYMKIALAMVDAVDALVMLDGWRYSKGARIEHRYASEHGKILLYDKEYRSLMKMHDDTMSAWPWEKEVAE